MRRGSSSPVVVETGAGTFLTKLHGAAQGVLPLIAEVVVAELANAIGLAVPDRALIELDDDTPSDDRNDELADLLRRSVGTNLGFRYLQGARDFVAGRDRPLDADVAARILWLDGLVANPDRTERNTNVLVWNGQPWLIDHGAALAFHYRFRSLTEQAPRALDFDAPGHLFARTSAALSVVDEECARLVPRDVLSRAVAEVPASFLEEAFPGEAPRRMRELYVAYLWKRLKPPRPFLPAG